MWNFIVYEIDSYVMVDICLIWVDVEDKWLIVVYIDNLFDLDYEFIGFDVIGFYGIS